jgi:aspartate racemase
MAGASLNYPMNDVVRWNPAEGIIGVVGLSPAATADFYQRLIALTPARKDWDHARVLIDSNPKIPSRGRHLELGEPDPSPFIRRAIDGLVERGATVVAVPCNTAHILYERYAAGIEALVPDMVGLAVERLAADAGGTPRQLAVLGTRHTIRHDRYGRRLRTSGGDVFDVGPWQPELSALIEHVKQGCDLSSGTDRLRNVMVQVERAGADSFVVACTELSVLVRPGWTRVPVVDASDTLARYCLDVARCGRRKPVGC